MEREIRWNGKDYLINGGRLTGKGRLHLTCVEKSKYKVPTIGAVFASPSREELLRMDALFKDPESKSRAMRAGELAEEAAIKMMQTPHPPIFLGRAAWGAFKNHPLLKKTKSKTKYITFVHEKRTITLCGKNTGNRIDVGYSVYCDSVFDARKSDTPKDEELSKNIAKGRMEKKPFYSVNITDIPCEFILAAMEVVKNKIRNGELVIKGIRNPKKR